VFWLSDVHGATRTVAQRTVVDSSPAQPEPRFGEAWVETAAGTLGVMTRELLDRMAGSPCDLSLPTDRDLASLRLGAVEHDRAQSLLPSLTARTHEACELVRLGEGSWIMAPDRVGALVAVGTRKLTLEAPLGQERGRLCLGAPTRAWL